MSLKPLPKRMSPVPPVDAKFWRVTVAFILPTVGKVGFKNEFLSKDCASVSDDALMPAVTIHFPVARTPAASLQNREVSDDQIDDSQEVNPVLDELVTSEYPN